MTKKNAESATVPPRVDSTDDEAGDFMRSHEMSPQPREIRIAMLTFLSKGQVIASPREAMDRVIARTDHQRDGYDIYLRLDEDRFRFEFHEGRDTRIRYIHVSRVDAYEEWSDRVQSPPNKAA